MINLDNIVNNNNEKHNENWPYLPEYSYRILIIGASGSGKRNTLLNIFMNTESSKTNESHRFRLDLTDKRNLKNPKKI